MMFRPAAMISGLLLLLSGCTTQVSTGAADRGQTTATADRIYVIDCGENHAKDLSLWTTPADRGKPYVFSDNCYLIKHRADWMLWDSGISDRIGELPDGLSDPRGTLFMKKPLVASLKEIGVAPADIRYFAMSHSHADHSGNANLFAASTIYMQAAEYNAVFGPDPRRYNFFPANFEKLRDAKIVKLNGDYDVFGDGSVIIKATPGHTPGHQSLFVRLRKFGPVLLSGDFVHLKSNWDAKRVPVINYDAQQSLRTMNEMDIFIKQTGATLWINHDAEQSATIPKAPAFID
ncbi:N-acyl homoserine lactonase family protein [Burkholderia latens]|uniref:N-acyl homoserine lactonase family protein n=1 Tax=Burkholderia latens TaxID=488446 RepID=UPI001C94693A|nr:N-acyl homoserine lactonase family protein [Burkholderia latens]MBY4694793.1 N-acyl homoserine lactonase family protein [Burkholderia latens]